VLIKIKGGRVDAVAQSGGIWTVGKDVAEVRIARLAPHFNAHHSMRGIGVFGDNSVDVWLRKAGPPASGFKFIPRGKERFAATDTAIHPFAMMVPIDPREGSLRRTLARYGILLWA
jgi:hypothetical protein